MQWHRLHKLSSEPRFIGATSKRGKKEPLEKSGIVDMMEMGADSLLAGGFEEYIRQTTFDPALGWPLDGRNAISESIPGFSIDSADDLETGDENEPLRPRSGPSVEGQIIIRGSI